MIIITGNKSKSRIRETMTPDFNVEHLRKDIKPQAYNQSKTSFMKNKKLNTRFYFAKVGKSFLDHLTSIFPLLASHILLLEHT